MMQDIGRILEGIADEIIEETEQRAGQMGEITAKIAELTGQIDKIREHLETFVFFARVTGEDDEGVFISTGWKHDATDDQLHAAMVSIIEDITGNDRLQGLFLEALQTHFGELDDTSGRRS